ncbi:hypothetical protein CEXT_453061 [Caerostris extrusa]|uniref:Uncharacterized protein n=1 Tax=Caerostris extrusa TaxID=172846 RepID=A0AAV4XWS2_CAEEX|nr:hypothetical protein CEXT_453061 [Caerostris extrusa]
MNSHPRRRKRRRTPHSPDVTSFLRGADGALPPHLVSKVIASQILDDISDNNRKFASKFALIFPSKLSVLKIAGRMAFPFQVQHASPPGRAASEKGACYFEPRGSRGEVGEFVPRMYSGSCRR